MRLVIGNTLLDMFLNVEFRNETAARFVIGHRHKTEMRLRLPINVRRYGKPSRLALRPEAQCRGKTRCRESCRTTISV